MLGRLSSPKPAGKAAAPQHCHPTRLKSRLSAQVAEWLVVPTFKQYSCLPFKPQPACVKSIFSLTSLHTFLINMPLPCFQPQGPFFRGEADTRDLTPLPGLAPQQMLLTGCSRRRECCTSPPPRPYSVFWCFDICGTHNLQPP